MSFEVLAESVGTIFVYDARPQPRGQNYGLDFGFKHLASFNISDGVCVCVSEWSFNGLVKHGVVTLVLLKRRCNSVIIFSVRCQKNLTIEWH